MNHSKYYSYIIKKILFYSCFEYQIINFIIISTLSKIVFVLIDSFLSWILLEKSFESYLSRNYGPINSKTVVDIIVEKLDYEKTALDFNNIWVNFSFGSLNISRWHSFKCYKRCEFYFRANKRCNERTHLL